MTIAEVIRVLEEKHTSIDNVERTCDGIICGDINQECRGIVLTCCATAELIKKAAELGYNMIICHEPTFYHGYDEQEWLQKTFIYEKKKELIEKYGIVIYRDHDRVHAEEADMIYSGIVKTLGWEAYALDNKFFPSSGYEIPETTLGELGCYVADKLGIDGMRIVGDSEMKVRKVGLTAHFSGGQADQDCIQEIEKNDYDVVIPLEIVDWTITEYLIDSTALGRPRGMLNAGHFNLEEPGMMAMQEWVSEAIGQTIPVVFIQWANAYKWIAGNKIKEFR